MVKIVMDQTKDSPRTMTREGTNLTNGDSEEPSLKQWKSILNGFIRPLVSEGSLTNLTEES